MSKKLPPLHITDLLRQQKNRQINILGRDKEMSHLARLIQRKNHNNLLIVGRRGSGKTSLMHGFSKGMLEGAFKALPSLPYIKIDTSFLSKFIYEATHKEVAVYHIKSAFHSLPPSVVFIDDAERIISNLDDLWQFEQIFSPFISSSNHHLVLIIEEEKWDEFKETYHRMFKSFDILTVKELSDKVCHRILTDKASYISKAYGIKMVKEAIDAVLEYGRQLPSARAMPDKALRFFDEVAAACVIAEKKILTPAEVQQVYADRIGIPSRNLSRQDKSVLKNLEKRLKEQVIGQENTVKLVAKTIQRGSLGLKNPNRPLGSFLFLGPSGVGKTELTKTITKEVYGTDKAMVRIDMSEFAEPHTVQRLLGAPPGYVGHEAGGQLTNPVRERPHSLILLDEIEKAHPSIFDIFLQVLDDGHLTDGQGQTVDFKNTVVIATSNIGINEIVDGWMKGCDINSDEFKQAYLMPLMLKIFRLEFINRFERVSVFNPLSEAVLYNIALLEIKKIEQRFSRYNAKIKIPNDLLQRKVKEFADPRFGARPLKRFIEQTCESMLADRLLNNV